MALKLTTRTADAATIVAVSGDILWPDGAEQLRKEITTLLHEGKTKIVIDLANCTYIDSGGVGTLVACKVSASHRGGDVVLLRLAARIREVLIVTRLMTAFSVFESEQEAVAALR